MVQRLKGHVAVILKAGALNLNRERIHVCSQRNDWLALAYGAYDTSLGDRVLKLDSKAVQLIPAVQ